MLHAFHAGYYDRRQLVGFFGEDPELLDRGDLCLREDLQPVGGLLQLLQGQFKLAHKLCSGSRSMRLTAVGADRCSRASHLLPDHLSYGRLWQGRVHPDDSEREMPRPSVQVRQPGQLGPCTHGSCIIHSLPPSISGSSSFIIVV